MVTNDGIIFFMEQTSKIENLFLAGKLIIAMPTMSDPRFKRSVVCICAHNEDGAIGIIINKIIESLSFSKILSSTFVGITLRSSDQFAISSKALIDFDFF